MLNRIACIALAILLPCLPGRAELAPEKAKAIYDRVTPSIVAVQYTWESELGRRELTGAGIVVGEDGLVITSIALFDMRIPDAQMRDFKVIVPRPDGSEPDELDAAFLGRDERTDMAFVKVRGETAATSTSAASKSAAGDADTRPATAASKRKWASVKFENVPLAVGEPLVSIGLLPKEAGYKTYLTYASVASLLRGPVPLVLVSGGGLGAVGAPVFNAEGRAVGFVNAQQDQQAFLNDPRDPLGAVTRPARFFVPTRDFELSLTDPPREGEAMHIPWIGIPQSAMAGLNQDVAEMLGLKNVPAVELGDILEGSPAQKAGLTSGDILLKVNGEPLARGDSPDEMPEILVRQIRRLHVGDTVKLTLFGGKDKPPRELSIKLEERPKGPNLAERFWAEDLGFSVREVVFVDTYFRRLKPDAKGVVVALLKPNGAAANAHLQVNDMITELNNTPVESLEQFKETYQAFRKSNPRDAIVLEVLREGGTQVIRIEPPQ